MALKTLTIFIFLIILGALINEFIPLVMIAIMFIIFIYFLIKESYVSIRAKYIKKHKLYFRILKMFKEVNTYKKTMDRLGNEKFKNDIYSIFDLPGIAFHGIKAEKYINENMKSFTGIKESMDKIGKIFIKKGLSYDDFLESKINT